MRCRCVGQTPHWHFVINVSLAPLVPKLALLPAISSPEFRMVSVAASYEYRFPLKAVSLPYFSESAPFKSQRNPSVTVRLLRTL